MVRKIWLLLIFSLVLVGNITADNQVILERGFIASAGESVTDNNQTIILNGSLAEPIVSQITITSGYGLASGYWAGMNGEGAVYLPMIMNGE